MCGVRYRICKSISAGKRSTLTLSLLLSWKLLNKLDVLVKMAKVAPMFYAVLILGVMAVGLHIVGYTTPGWLILTRKFEVEEIKITTDVLMKQSFFVEEIETGPTDPNRPTIDEGGVPPEMDDGMPEPHPGKPPHQKMTGPQPSPHHIALIEETTEIQEWIKATVVSL